METETVTCDFETYLSFEASNLSEGSGSDAGQSQINCLITD